jgi:hypothetical protein
MLFEYQGKPFVGWQKTGVLEEMFGCTVDPVANLWLPSTEIAGANSSVVPCPQCNTPIPERDLVHHVVHAHSGLRIHCPYCANGRPVFGRDFRQHMERKHDWHPLNPERFYQRCPLCGQRVRGERLNDHVLHKCNKRRSLRA